MLLGMGVNLGSGEFVFDGDPAAPPERGTAPRFSVHVYCGQKAAWMNTPLGTEVDLGPGHIVLDVDPAFPSKGTQQPLPLLGRCPLWARSPISAIAELLYDLWLPLYSLCASFSMTRSGSWPNWFLANVNSRSRSLYAIARPSVCRLSSVCLSSVVCNVRGPTQAVQIFGNISTALGTLAIH